MTLIPSVGIAEKRPVKIDGVVRSGYQADQQFGPRAELELKVTTRRVEGTKAVIKIEGRYFRDRVEVEDAYLDHKVSARVRFQFGVNKKRLGMEYQESSKERLTPNRSLIYRKMEGLGLVGRQLNLRLVTKHDRLSAHVLVGTDGSRNVNLAVYLGQEHGNVGYGYWGLIERHRVNKDYLPVTAHALSAWIRSSKVRATVELIGGIDSFETEANLIFEEGQRVWFAGPKLELAYRFEPGGGFHIQPLAQASMVIHDTGEFRRHTTQLLAGLNLHYRRISGAINVEHLRSTRTQEEASPRRVNVYVEGKYHF